MKGQLKSIRPFIGTRDFEISRAFYRDFGFDETVLAPGFCVYKSGDFAFYLQDADIRDWIDNTQVFLETDDTEYFHARLSSLNLESKYAGVRLSAIRKEHWGKEFFVHDPSGILWHIGEFYAR